MSHQTPKTYRGKLPKPDKRGYVRPEIGDNRFTVGNVRSDSQGEMERRRDAVADPFFCYMRQWVSSNVTISHGAVWVAVPPTLNKVGCQATCVRAVVAGT